MPAVLIKKLWIMQRNEGQMFFYRYDVFHFARRAALCLLQYLPLTRPGGEGCVKSLSCKANRSMPEGLSR